MSNFLLETVKAQPCSMVVVHPTVLLSIVDHYNRSGNATTSKRRVVGTLIGEYGDKGQLHVTNSFAVPFNEDLAECLQAGPLTDGDTLHERHHDHQLPEQYGVVGSH